MSDSYSNAVWKLRTLSSQVSSEICIRNLGISEVTAKVLQSRDFETVDDVRDFWTPRLERLHDPSSFKDMDRASERLARAVRSGEKIVVWGDYDVDGATSVSLLLRFFRFIGAHVDFHIPNRLRDGYGLNVEGLKKIAHSGASVVVTVDTGISAYAEANQAKELGLDLIITDHHEPGAESLKAYAVIDPKQPDCSYPDKRLAGVGVAFKVACATATALTRQGSLSDELKEFLLRSLSLVALGTVADLVPLTGENRVLVGYGLHQINRSTWPGLRALIEISNCAEDVTSSDIAFRLGPRLNAAGRLSSARIGVELLTTEDSRAAHTLAKELDKSNRERRHIELAHSKEAQRFVENAQLSQENILIVSGEGWHPGVIGIVASRLVERFHLPAVVVAFNGEEGKGSCRSVEGFHLHEALSQIGDLFEAFGGHAMAAGFSIQKKNFDRFKSRMSEIACSHFLSPPKRSLYIDAWVDLNRVTEALLTELNHLAPFGMNNPPPVFATTGVSLSGVRRMGRDGSHLSFQSVAPETSLRSVAYQAGDLYHDLSANKKWDVAFQPKLNVWRGTRQIELDIKGLRPAGVVS